eukprot:TRINITY_DN11394_c0_g6_i1.p1 TRINITY_DN11394_c0_g6~~TRINITY_DN11394_c0_g6_i1.p1  ORF type:complete len:584 (-),score=88.16 TRINITY_DN11394_c0_g6_i1:118-1869(-)
MARVSMSCFHAFLLLALLHEGEVQAATYGRDRHPIHELHWKHVFSTHKAVQTQRRGKSMDLDWQKQTAGAMSERAAKMIHQAKLSSVSRRATDSQAAAAPVVPALVALPGSHAVAPALVSNRAPHRHRALFRQENASSPAPDPSPSPAASPDPAPAPAPDPSPSPAASPDPAPAPAPAPASANGSANASSPAAAPDPAPAPASANANASSPAATPAPKPKAKAAGNASAPAPTKKPANATASANASATSGGGSPAGGFPDTVGACSGKSDGEKCGKNALDQQNKVVDGTCQSININGMQTAACMATDLLVCETKEIGEACETTWFCGNDPKPCSGRCADAGGKEGVSKFCMTEVFAPPDAAVKSCEDKPEGSDCGNNAPLNGKNVAGKCKMITFFGVGTPTCVPMDLLVCDAKELGSQCVMDHACPSGGTGGCSGVCSPGDEGSPFDRVCAIPDTSPMGSGGGGSICTGKEDGADCGKNAEYDDKHVEGKCIEIKDESNVVNLCVPKDAFSCQDKNLGDSCSMTDFCPPTANRSCSGTCGEGGDDVPVDLVCKIMEQLPSHACYSHSMSLLVFVAFMARLSIS